MIENMNISSLAKSPALMTMEKPSPDLNLQKIEEAAKEFESMFVAEMLKPMFDGLDPDPMFGGGKTEEIFNGFMREEYGKMIAQTNQFGIADQVKQQLIELQSRQNGEALAQNVHGHNSGKTKGATDETNGA